MAQIVYSWDFRLPTGRPLSERIILAACEEFDCTVEQLKSHSKFNGLPMYRFITYYLLRKHVSPITVKQIGALFNRDHSSVVVGLQRVDDMMFLNDPIIKRLVTIENKLFKSK